MTISCQRSVSGLSFQDIAERIGQLSQFALQGRFHHEIPQLHQDGGIVSKVGVSSFCKSGSRGSSIVNGNVPGVAHRLVPQGCPRLVTDKSMMSSATSNQAWSHSMAHPNTAS